MHDRGPRLRRGRACESASKRADSNHERYVGGRSQLKTLKFPQNSQENGEKIRNKKCPHLAQLERVNFSRCSGYALGAQARVLGSSPAADSAIHCYWAKARCSTRYGQVERFVQTSCST